MSSDFSSFDKDKKIFDGWRQFLNESAAPGMVVLDEDENLEEQGIGGGSAQRSEIKPAGVGQNESLARIVAEELEELAPVAGQSRPATEQELSQRLGGSAEGHAHGQSMPERDTIGGFTPLRPDTQGPKGETTLGRRTEKPAKRPAQSLPGQPVAKGTKIPGVGGKPKYRTQVTRRQAQTGGVVGRETPFGTEVMNIPSTWRADESLARVVTQELEKILNEKNTIPNPEYTGGPRPEYENTVGSPVVYQPPQAPPEPAGIEIDPVAKAHMDQRPEFDDLGVEDEVVDGRSTGRQLYRTADLETFKIGTDMDFLSNRTPLPSIRMAHQKGLIDPRTNRLTDLGKGVVSGWKEKHGNQAMRENLNFDYIVQEVYKRLNKPKGK